MRVEHIASMSWRRGASWRHSCLPSRHHRLVIWELGILLACLEEEEYVIHAYLQDIIRMKNVGKTQGWSRPSARSGIKLINTQSIEDEPCGIVWSHGMVSIFHYSLCTNPWSMCVVYWYFYVGLGIFPWACIKRKISYSLRERVAIKVLECKFKRSIFKISYAWSLTTIWC